MIIYHLPPIKRTSTAVDGLLWVVEVVAGGLLVGGWACHQESDMNKASIVRTLKNNQPYPSRETFGLLFLTLRNTCFFEILWGGCAKMSFEH